MSAVEFRPALSEEATHLSEIAFAAKNHWGYPREWMELWRPDLTITARYLETEKVCVAESDGEVIGFAGLASCDYGRHIEHMWLKPLHIGRGLGRKLFGEVIRLARLESTRKLFVLSDPNAEAFYLKMGAVRIGQETYELPGGIGRKVPVLVFRLS
jgi:GNAT superfamily N-acetyltransferase